MRRLDECCCCCCCGTGGEASSVSGSPVMNLAFFVWGWQGGAVAVASLFLFLAEVVVVGGRWAVGVDVGVGKEGGAVDAEFVAAGWWWWPLLVDKVVVLVVVVVPFVALPATGIVLGEAETGIGTGTGTGTGSASPRLRTLSSLTTFFHLLSRTS